MNAKSIYSQQLKVLPSTEIDQRLETATGINLQGRVSFEKCVQASSMVGENIYVMSPNLDIGGSLSGNGIPVQNGVDMPYCIPHTMSLFQPSGANMSDSGIGDFVKWYELHNRKTVVTLSEEYGGNVSDLKCLGSGSYELELATYGPTEVVVEPVNSSEQTRKVGLDSESLNGIMNGVDARNVYQEGKYVIGNGTRGNVGFFFNLSDSFVTGEDKTLRVTVPIDKDYTNLRLMFGVELVSKIDESRNEELVAEVYVNGSQVYRSEEPNMGPEAIRIDIPNANVQEHVYDISVRIHYEVDFSNKGASDEYAQQLKDSGVLLRNIRIENGVESQPEQLTFGSYINESGISDDERNARCDQFWAVAKYKEDVTYQTIVESSLKNVLTNGVKYPNNYSSGDIYGDMFVTKSLLDPQYDMDIWSEDGKLCAIGRDYIGLGACSNQLSLLYKPTKVKIDMDVENGVGVERDEDDELKYQMVEVVKNINRFESSIKHKMNVFSVVVENSNLVEDTSDSADEVLEKYKKQLRDAVTQFVRDTCEGIVPVHT